MELAQRVREATRYAADYPITIAVMGCRVNGPGETDHADLGLWCGPDSFNLKRGGTSAGDHFPTRRSSPGSEELERSIASHRMKHYDSSTEFPPPKDGRVAGGILAAALFRPWRALPGWPVSAFVAWSMTLGSSGPFAEPPPAARCRRLSRGVRLQPATASRSGAGSFEAIGARSRAVAARQSAARRRDMLPVMRWLAEKGPLHRAGDQLRGQGDSTGEVIDIGWSARHDVVAAVKFSPRDVPGTAGFCSGPSMGAAAAIFAAKELQGDVAGYFFEQPYKDLKSAVWTRLHRHVPPVLDWSAYSGLRLRAPVFLAGEPGQISPYEHI